VSNRSPGSVPGHAPSLDKHGLGRDRAIHCQCARLIEWALHVLAPRTRKPGKDSAAYLTDQPAPASEPTPASPWVRPWTGASSDVVRGIFPAEKTDGLTPDQRERPRNDPLRLPHMRPEAHPGTDPGPHSHETPVSPQRVQRAPFGHSSGRGFLRLRPSCPWSADTPPDYRTSVDRCNQRASHVSILCVTRGGTAVERKKTIWIAAGAAVLVIAGISSLLGGASAKPDSEVRPLAVYSAPA
jgi:hypothetical protein